MEEASSFVEAIRAAAGELRLEPRAPVRLNRVAARIDHLGRRVHGLEWVRDREIGGCLTAAVLELSRAQGLPEVDCAGAVRNALLQLGEALVHADEGLRPRRSGPVTDLAAQEGARDERD